MDKHSEKVKNEPQKVSSETYSELAKLAHESFNQRRNYEWKAHLGLWSSVGLVVYVAIKEHIEISISWLILAAIMVFIAYAIHLIMVSWGHWIDKKYKHYYTRKAEGDTKATLEEEGKRPEDVKWIKTIDVKQAFWISPYLLFVISLLVTAIFLLDANNKKVTTHNSKKQQPKLESNQSTYLKKQKTGQQFHSADGVKVGGANAGSAVGATSDE